MSGRMLDSLCSHVCPDTVSSVDDLFSNSKLKAVFRKHPYVIVTKDSSNSILSGNMIGKYPVLGSFDVSNILSFDIESKYSEVEYILYALAKGNQQKPSEIKTGCYRGSTTSSKYSDVDSWRYDILNKELQNFLKNVLDWVYSGILPEESDFYTVGSIDSHDESVYDYIKNPDHATELGRRIHEMDEDTIPSGNRYLARLDDFSEVFYYGKGPFIDEIRSYKTGVKNRWETIDTRPGPGDIFIDAKKGKVSILTSENMNRLGEGIVVRVHDPRNRGPIAATLCSKVFREINHHSIEGSLEGVDNLARSQVVIPGDKDYWNDNILYAIDGRLSPEKYNELDLELRQHAIKEDELYSMILKSMNRDINKSKFQNLAGMVSIYYNESIQCRYVRAFLSSSVMLGSVLETVAIDWVNDILIKQGEKDLFSYDVKLKTYTGNNESKDSLCGYIDLICKHIPAEE